MATKRCARCREYKEVSNFNSNKSCSDGLSAYCRDCWRIIQQEHLAKPGNRERANARANELHNAYNAKNRTAVRLYARNRFHERYTTDEKFRKQAIQKVRNREALVRGSSGGIVTAQEWEDLKRQYGYKCLACGKKKPLTQDHVIPLSKGGSNKINNIQPLCKSCNSTKQTNSTDYRQGK